MTEYSKAKPKARFPLGSYVARFLSPQYDNAHQALELLGEERSARVLRGLSKLKLRAFEKKGAIKMGPVVHDANAPHVGRFLAYVALVLEQCQPGSRRACGRALYQGRTRQWNAEQKRVEYVPAKSAGGLAARLGISPREIQRYQKLAQVLELFEVWQIKAKETVQALPKQMRGKRWSYNIYRWCGDLPRAAVAALTEWGRAKPSPSSQALAGAAEPPRTGMPSASLFVAMLARLDGPDPTPS